MAGFSRPAFCDLDDIFVTNRLEIVGRVRIPGAPAVPYTHPQPAINATYIGLRHHHGTGSTPVESPATC